MVTGVIVTFVVGVVCIALGISHMRGNISSLHSYHRHRVSEEDRIPFGKLVGKGTIIIGISVMVQGVFYLLFDLSKNEVLMLVGSVIMGIGMVVGIGIAFYAMIKYNKGIF